MVEQLHMLSSQIVSTSTRQWSKRVVLVCQKYAPKDAALKALEAEARGQKRGLWIDPNPVPLQNSGRRNLAVPARAQLESSLVFGEFLALRGIA
jgi:hypothetical protein